MKAEQLNRLYDVCLYVLVVLPVLALAGSNALPVLLALAFLVALAASWVVYQSGVGRTVSERVWNTIVFGFVGLSVVRVFATDTDALDTVVQLLLVLTLVKLYGRLSARDELQVFVLTFITLAAATTITDQLMFGVAFSLYVLVGTFGLAVFHLKDEVHQRPKLSFRGITTLNTQYATVLGTMSGVVLAASLTIFFTFPRVGMGFFAPKFREATSMTGFSESVELGNHGVIRNNPAVVMRVEFDERPTDTASFHWRIMAFDHYDGRAWTRTMSGRKRHAPTVADDRVPKVAGVATLQYLQSLAEVYSGVGEPRHMQVYLEPLGTTLLPTLWPPTSIRLGSDAVSVPFGPRSGLVQLDPYGDVHHTVTDQVGMTYQLWAWPFGGELRRRTDLEPFLQLPPFSERVATYAQGIAPAAATPSEVGRAIAETFQRDFVYTTDLPEVGASPVESFLFETKRGHCEYFATSAVMLFRARGVPARIVNGFLGGAWNDVGNYLAVRQGDAHTWVEYHEDGVWKMLDPTPTSAAGADADAGARLRQYYDTLKLFWTKWIIEYDLNSQLAIFKGLSNSFRGAPTRNDVDTSKVEKDDRVSLGWGPWAFALAAALMGFGLGRQARRKRWSVAVAAVSSGAALAGIAGGGLAAFDTSIAALATTAFVTAGVAGWFSVRRLTDDAEAWYRVESAAKRVGLSRASDEGPQTFLTRVAAAVPRAKSDIDAFSQAYLRARFSPSQLPDSDLLEKATLLAAAIRAAKETHD